MGLWERIYLKFWRALRDFRCYFLFTFRPRYAIEQIKLRKGTCPPNCPASCCVGCEHLTKNKRCAIYKKRPQHCRDGPIDRFDVWMLERIYGKGCRLYWD